MEITDCTFSNNSSRYNGFSIFNRAVSSLSLKNSSFKRDGEPILQDNHLNNEIFNRGIINVEDSQKEAFKKFIKYGFLHVVSDNFKSFRHLANQIRMAEGKVILDCDINFADGEEEIVIDADDLVIDGRGHAIDALAKGSIFTIKSKNVTLKNIEFHNSNSKDGALLINEGASLNIIDCSFENNLSENGGAITNNGVLNVEGCDFENNFSKKDFGAAINNKGEMKLVKSDFCNNISRNAGGAINNCNYADLEECCFKSNISEQGGAISNIDDGLMNIIKCTFKENVSFGQASVIFNDNYMNIKSCEFSANASDEDCHAIYHKGNEDSELLIENSSFSHYLSNNNLIYLEEGFCRIYSSKFDVNDDSYCIHNQNSNLRFEKSRFISSNEKAIFNEGILNIREEDKMEDRIKNCGELNYLGKKVPEDWKGFTYLDNLIHSGSIHVSLSHDIEIHFSEQDFYESGIELNIDNLVIDGNYHTIDANNFSRIFIISAENVVLKNIRFKKGKYFKSKFDGENVGGGAIYAMPESSVEIDQCVFLENKSRESAGAIMNKAKSFKITKTLFENNHARNMGGALFNEDSSVEIRGCDFIKNASGSSGAVHNENSQVDVFQVTFTGNSANKCGAISNNDSHVEFRDCSFTSNLSNGIGGAVLIDKNSSEFNGCEFVKNSSKGRGGAIFNNSGEITLTDCKFSKNSSNEDGGSIFNIEGCFKFVGCSFIGNSASNRGGVIENNLKSKAYLSDCSFSKNSANDGGAISNLKKCNLALKNCEFKDNNALENGGVIYNWYGFVDIEDSAFTGNESEYAGAIDNYLGWANIKRSQFKDNNVKRHAGALFNGGMLESLEDCTFKNNQSLLKGGAIYTTKSSSGNISRTLFDSNRANGNGGLGGAIYNGSFYNGNEEFSLDLSQCEFTGNYANDDGGAVFNKGHLNLNKCDFTDNKTNKYGKTLRNDGDDVKVSIKNTNIDDEF
jgi:predicted outer membrane repeat protein